MTSKERGDVYMTPEEARAIRERLGWTLAETAEMMGVAGGRQNYHQFEVGIRRFTFAQAELLRAYDHGYRRKRRIVKEKANG
jgi:transcriptional regulator with XRE-family HTH domain